MAEIEPSLVHMDKEYYYLQSIVDGINTTCITIKNWSVTVSVAFAGLAYAQGVDELLLLASGSAVLFWMTEAYWRANQWSFIRRIRQLEEAFERKTQIDAPRISLSWEEYWKKDGSLLGYIRHLMQWRSITIHGFIVAAGISLFAFSPPSGGFLAEENQVESGKAP